MRILLVHPEDIPERGDWAGRNWDWVIDLGRAGPRTYELWSVRFGCAAEPLDILEVEEIRSIRTLIARGLGHVVDREGLDWWELNVMFFHQKLEMLVGLQTLVHQLGAEDQLHVTRPGFHADALKLLIGHRLKCFSGRVISGVRSLNHYRRL